MATAAEAASEMKLLAGELEARGMIAGGTIPRAHPATHQN